MGLTVLELNLNLKILIETTQNGTLSGSMKHILAIDQGTTGTKTLLVDETLKVVAEKTIDFEQHFPKPGWVEHDLEEIWQTVLKGIQAVTKKIEPKSIAAIGITNQRETICFWDKQTGLPLTRAIVWQDRRTADTCETLKKKGIEPFVQESTGLLLDPYFSGTKAAWALKNVDAVRSASEQGRLAIGTIDSYLIARLTHGTVHATEPSNASRTLCFHLTEHRWDPELCHTIGVPEELWPEVKPSVGSFGGTSKVAGLPDGIPISGVLGDQQSALLGQACVHEGMAKCTYGTGAFLLMNTGKKPARSKHRLLSTVAWALDDQNYTYALEGSAFIAGAAVQWARDGLKLIKKSEDIEKLAARVATTEGVTFVPALTGLGAPYWNPHAQGLLTGITRGTSNAHIARAILEGIAFQNADLLSAMQKDLGKPLTALNVDGGACQNDLLMQFQSDILGTQLRRPEMIQTTSLGAVFAAGLGIGLWKDLNEIEKTWKEERTFDSQMDESARKSEMRRWHAAISQATHSSNQ